MADGLRIDAHHHVWDLAVRDQEWTSGLPTLRRSFGIGDLRPALVRHGIDATVVVQTVTVAEETPELLALAAEHDVVRGVVGWVDLTHADVAGALASLREVPGGRRLVGIRHQVQLEPDPAWLLRADVRRGLEAVAAAGLVYELVVTHDQLPSVIAAVRTVPGLRWVLDHAGKPPIEAATLDPWRAQLLALAAQETVACKLSGLVTEADADWTADQLVPYAAHVLDAFGPERVMFGSDWPVCLLRASYDDVVALAERFVAELSRTEQEQVWGGAAQRWYGIQRD